MAKDINLVPQQVKEEQAKKRLVKKTTLFSLLLLVLVGLGTGYLVFRRFTLQNNIDSAVSKIESLRSEISSKKEIEVKARTLDKQYSTIDSVLSNRENYSLLLKELRSRLPSSVDIETFTTGKESTINLSGKGDDYLSVAEFVTNLSNSEYPNGADGLKTLFSDVSLNSVNLDTQSSKARFFIVVTVDASLLQEGGM